MSRLDDNYVMVTDLLDKTDSMTEMEYRLVQKLADYEGQGLTFTHEEALQIEELHELFCN